MKKIYMIDIPHYNDRAVVVNLHNYKLTKKIRENLENPLYLIYYTALRKPELLKDIDIDYYFYAGKKILKINPAKCGPKDYTKIRIEMTKIMNGITEQAIIDEVTDEKNV
jgi:hypothetical protein